MSKLELSLRYTEEDWPTRNATPKNDAMPGRRIFLKLHRRRKIRATVNAAAYTDFRIKMILDWNSDYL
jgi:hypothetical protein